GLYAIAIPAAMSDFLLSLGYWDQAAALHQTALTTAGQAGAPPGAAGAPLQPGLVPRLTGGYPAATPRLARAPAPCRALGDRPRPASALTQLGILHELIGDHAAAAASHQTAVTTAGQAGARPEEAGALIQLCMVQRLTGDYPAATASVTRALALYRDLGDRF